MLKYNPKDRPSASQLIIHPFFKVDSEVNNTSFTDNDTYDSLKISRNGIRIRKNQKFKGLGSKIQPNSNLGKLNMELPPSKSIFNYQKMADPQPSEPTSYPSMYNSTEESKYSDIDYSKFTDSALLANEKNRKKEKPKIVAGSGSGLTNYQSLSNLNTDRVFKKAGLSSIDKPPMIPKFPMMSRVKLSQDRGEKNSLRRSNSYKNFKRVTEIDRASAPVDLVLSKNNDFSLQKEIERMSNPHNLPMPERSNSIPYPAPMGVGTHGFPPPLQKFSSPDSNDEYYSKGEVENR